MTIAMMVSLGKVSKLLTETQWCFKGPVLKATLQRFDSVCTSVRDCFQSTGDSLAHLGWMLRSCETTAQSEVSTTINCPNGLHHMLLVSLKTHCIQYWASTDHEEQPAVYASTAAFTAASASLVHFSCRKACACLKSLR